MSSRTISIAALFFGGLSICSTGRAWDAPGHEIVAMIAQSELSADARMAVERLLSAGETMVTVSTWADQARSVDPYKYTYGFHFADALSLDSNFYTVPVNPKGDAVQALAHYEDTLRGQASDVYKGDALKFFIHFVGDLHQPLHAAVHSDLGGNGIPVTWLGQSTFNNGLSKMELHEVWDGQMINHFASNWIDPKASPGSPTSATSKEWEVRYAEYLRQAYPTAVLAVSELENQTYIDWALESHAFNQQAYDRGDGVYMNQSSANINNPNLVPALGEDYYRKNLPIVNLRLAQAGHRLANKLNQIFSGRPITPQEQGMREFIQIGCGGNCVVNEKLLP